MFFKYCSTKSKVISLKSRVGFHCYTSLSYAEFHIVTYGDLKRFKIDGHNCLLLNNGRIKTKIEYKIPIVSKQVMELLGKGEDFRKIFNPLTNQPTNRYLKQIMKSAKINKNIKFHRARHSCCTIFGIVTKTAHKLQAI